MRFSACLILLAACFGVAAGQDEKKFDGPTGPKYVFDFTEKTYGLKMKSAKLEGKDHVILLEFIKDVATTQELNAIGSAFRTSGQTGGKSPIVLFYFFDADNVVLGKAPLYKLDGEITGKKGDAFRISVRQWEPMFGPPRATAKIEARSSESGLPSGEKGVFKEEKK